MSSHVSADHWTVRSAVGGGCVSVCVVLHAGVIAFAAITSGSSVTPLLRFERTHSWCCGMCACLLTTMWSCQAYYTLFDAQHKRVGFTPAKPAASTHTHNFLYSPVFWFAVLGGVVALGACTCVVTMLWARRRQQRRNALYRQAFHLEPGVSVPRFTAATPGSAYARMPEAPSSPQAALSSQPATSSVPAE